MIRDADRFKMDLIGGLERTLHGQVKPMITQCSMRHLYAAAKEPGVSFLIDKAKTYERRRCGHLPEDYPEPLSTHECLCAVVDPKGGGYNKHRYVVASQELETRKALRAVKGVPLVYINRSVMIMEPMADASVQLREHDEISKFRAGLKGRGSGSLKRKREEDVDGGSVPEAKKKSKAPGPKGPNPLSMMKSKRKKTDESARPKDPEIGQDAGQKDGDGEDQVKKKRKRKHKTKKAEDGVAKESAVGASEQHADGEDE